MNDLEYSNEALGAKGLFYNKEITVYVEGQDDPLFWEHLFNLAEIEAHVESVGGMKELKKYEEKILHENTSFYIAMDNDNSEFMNNNIEHPQIIKTYGYSIENSMYLNLPAIEKTISDFCRKKVAFSEDFNNWVSDFSKKTYDLIIYDIANNKYGKSISIFGDNCYRFLETKKSYKISSTKVTKFINSIKSKFSNEELNEIKSLVKQSEKDLWFLIKGHFITHALINLIKHTIRKNTGQSKGISTDFLYSVTVACNGNLEKRIDIKNIMNKIKLIKRCA